MPDTYLTIKLQSESLYKEKGSKFIGKSFEVTSEDEVKIVLEKLRKEYYDARHHCYAYIIGKNEEKHRANDDGEPNHSAGDPILGQIRSKNLTNVLVVVIRYFGGTKLGVGGLITAYKTAAKEALDNSGFQQKYWTKNLHLKIEYSKYNSLMALLKDFDGKIVQENYSGNEVELQLEFREGNVQPFLNKLNTLEHN